MSFVIHIGLPKSGSSYLQYILKNQLKDFVYLGKPYKDTNIYDIITYCIDDSIYDTKNFRNLDLNFNTNKKYFISDERFLNKTVADIGNCIKKIKEIFNPKILIILRNQVDLLYSAYRNNNFTFYGSKFKINANFDEIIQVSLNNNGPKHHFFRFLKYNSFLENLFDSISEERVKILFYEDLLSNSNFFLNELNKFLDEKLINKQIQINKTSFISKIFHRKNINTSRKIFEYYYDENHELNKKIKLPEKYLKFQE